MKNTLLQIEKQVLKKILPSDKERKKLYATIDELIKVVEDELKIRKIEATVELVGSTAKDTFLHNNLDIDLFIIFEPSIPKEEISRNALLIGKKILKKTEECYAEHPYIRGLYKSYPTEIVPCYRIEDISKKLSAVDRTPLHTKFIVENLKPEQRNEVRLFKQFLMGIECYGAEAAIEGFSGYLCELLILRYGSFIDVLKHGQKWNEGIKLSLTDEPIGNFDTPLIFIDPVDKERNVASALVNDRFKAFIFACKEFLNDPKITYFFPKKIDPWPLEKIKTEIEEEDCLYNGVVFLRPNIIDENLIPQIRKASKSIKDACEKYGFTIYDVNYFLPESKKQIYIIIKSDKKSIKKIYTHIGPPVLKKKNSDDFIKKWKDNPRAVKGPYDENGRLYVSLKRDYLTVEDFLNDQLKNLSMGKHLDDVIKKGFEIIDEKDLLKDFMRIYWTKNLDKKMNWER